MTQEGYIISGGTRLEGLLAAVASDDEEPDTDNESTSAASDDVDAASLAFPVPMRVRRRLDEFRIGEEGEEEESEDRTEIWVLGQDGVIVKLGSDGYWRDSLGRLARGPR